MKLLTIALYTICLLAMQGIYADVTYNDKIFTESVTDTGHVYIGQGDGADNALVTVKNGATWAIKDGNVYLGNESGTSRLLVENGAAFDASKQGQYLYVGADNGTYGVVTNKGSMNIAALYLARSRIDDASSNTEGAFRFGRFDNFGTVNVFRNFSVGQWKGDALSAMFYNHPGATLNVERDGQYAFYIGGRSSGCMTNAGSVVCNASGHLYVGRGLASTGKGKLVLLDGSTFKTGNNIVIGSSADGILEMYGNSTMGNENAQLKIGNAQKVKSSILLSDDSQLTIGSLYFCNAASVDANVILTGNGKLNHSDELLKVAIGTKSTGCIELLNHSMQEYPKNISLGCNSGALGIFRLNGTTTLNLSNAITLGAYAESTGVIELDGESALSVPGDFKIESGHSSATGGVRVVGNSRLIVANKTHIGASESRYGFLEVGGSALVNSTNISIAASKSISNQLGLMRIGDEGIVSNVFELAMGRGSTQYGYLEMRGGKLLLRSDKAAPKTQLTIGVNGESTAGIVSGWGFVGFDKPKDSMVDYVEAFGRGANDWGGLYLYGKVIADGLGENRDLDFSRAGVCVNQSYGKNDCKTNGWYATRNGRLLMPRSLPRLNKSHATIGDYPTLTNPRLVNSFRYDFDASAMNQTGAYVFSKLYATDRDDIPQGLPSGDGCVVSSVWNIGYFNATATPDVDDADLNNTHKQNYQSVKLKFHYDPKLVEVEGAYRIRVYRCADSGNGGWHRIGAAVPDASSPFVETREFGPSSELWNVGWFAIVAEPKKCTAIIVR